MRLALVALLATACAHGSSMPNQTWPALNAQLLTDSVETFNWRLGLPTVLAITLDGSVIYRRTPPRSFVASIYQLDTRTGKETMLLSGDDDTNLSDAEKARRERSRTVQRGIVDLDLSRDGAWMFYSRGNQLVFADRTSPKRAVERTIDGEVYDPHLSPDGKLVGYVQDGDLFVVGMEGPPRRLTKHPEGIEYGVADFAAMEELDRRRGWWWSPDSKQILFQRNDNRSIDTVYVSDVRHPEKKPVPFKYPRAGTNNAKVDLGLVSVDGGEPTWITWDTEKYPYLARCSWSAAGPATIVVLTREQQDVVAYALKGTQLEKLVEEHDDAWVNVPRPESTLYAAGTPLWIGDKFLWTTERTGDWTLELRDAAGTARPLAIPGLRTLVGADDHAAYVTASTDPLRQDVYRVPLDGKPATRITPGDGGYTADVASGVVVVSGALAKGGRVTFAIRDDKEHDLPAVAEHPSLVPTTVIEKIEIDGRTHYATITRPRDFDAKKKYPVLLKVYGGPHARTVEDARDGYVMDQFYADAGFVVVRSDNRGTPDRGRAWERAILKDLITVPLRDQVDVLQAMGKRHPEMDMKRVGVTGWSFGGYFSAMAVLLRPDVFAAGVAGAPVTDWQLYDTAYTERYMREPVHNPEGYKSTSALTHASKLSRPLLIIHGITDDNVHFAHSLSLIEALYVAGKFANVITLSATHMVPDPKLNLAREQVQIDFFRQHLGPPP
ncbi:MAG: S9 family peptidase [Deltaproteobacteria bacterium]|nr:S9 family peptidase [Deltaproteobacteria bacterium]